MSEENTSQNTYKRKRKKTVLRNARKYAKKGCFGRGYQVEEDVYQYFVRVLEANNAGFPSEEEQQIFANNVFEQTAQNEVNYSCNQIGSRVIETLIPHATDEVLQKYLQAFAGDLRPLCKERFASHVLKALLFESAKRREQNEGCKEFYLKVSRFLLNNMEDYMWDSYGNHSMRAVFTSILQFDENSVIFKIEGGIDETYREILEDYAQRLLVWPQFAELPFEELPSGFLQVLLKALRIINSKLLKTYLKKLNLVFAPKTDQEYNCGNWPPVFLSKASLMLLETALLVSKEKSFDLIYETCFKGLISKLAMTKSTSFCMQKFLNQVPDKQQFEEIFEELNSEETFAEIVNNSHPGVLLALGQACKRLSAKQGPFIQNLMKAFKCFEPQERQSKITLCLCKMVPFEGLKAENLHLEKEKLNLQGTLILQLLLTFNKPIKIIDSVLSLTKRELLGLLSNSMGSHITNSFVESPFVGEKSRERLIRSLQGCYQELAACKFGSRTFDLLWAAASTKLKLIIMEELSRKDAIWSNSEFGRIIATNVQLAKYKVNKEEWKNSIESASTGKTKKKNLLNDVLPQV